MIDTKGSETKTLPLRKLARVLLAAAMLSYVIYNCIIIFGSNDFNSVFNRVFEFSGFLMNFHFFFTIALFFTPTVTIISLAPIFALSAITGEMLFFEERLFKLLIQSGVTSFFTNQQQPKALLGLIVYAIYLVFFIFSRRKTLARFFNLLSYSVVIVTTFMFHKLMISGSMRDIEQVYLENLRNKMSYDQKHAGERAIDCGLKEINCISLNSADNFRYRIDQTPFEKHLLEILRTSEPGESSRVSFFDENGLMRNYIYLMKKLGPTTGYIFYNNRDFHDHKRKHLSRYFTLNIMAHLFWAFFNCFLVLFHSDIPRYRKMLGI